MKIEFCISGLVNAMLTYKNWDSKVKSIRKCKKRRLWRRVIEGIICLGNENLYNVFSIMPGNQTRKSTTAHKEE